VYAVSLEVEMPYNSVKPVTDHHNAANDDGLAAKSRAKSSLDDPCSEGGFDLSCRDQQGELCQFHRELCLPPHFPCIDKLRHFLAVRFLEQIAQGRARKPGSSSKKA